MKQTKIGSKNILYFLCLTLFGKLGLSYLGILNDFNPPLYPPVSILSITLLYFDIMSYKSNNSSTISFIYDLENSLIIYYFFFSLYFLN